MKRRILFPLCLSVLAGLAACGGKASGGGSDGDLPGSDVPGPDVPGLDVPSAQPPGVDLPALPPTSASVPSASAPSTDPSATVQTLELRRFDESNDASTGLTCEYSERVKVYFRSREMITKRCYAIDGGISGDRETKTLLDADIERIQQAYSALREAGGTQCQGSASWLSLAVVSPDDSEDRQLLDAEHAGCPLTGLAGAAFVQGLQQLYGLLAELQAK